MIYVSVRKALHRGLNNAKIQQSDFYFSAVVFLEQGVRINSWKQVLIRDRKIEIGSAFTRGLFLLPKKYIKGGLNERNQKTVKLFQGKV